jgi:TIR domain
MLERLRTHMAMLKREGLVTEWCDCEIEAGSRWRGEIERELEAADVILLLVSADFLASDFCYEKEMMRAVARARHGEALVIGVMLRPVDGWDATPFAEFQLVPRGARPISKWSNADEAYSDVVERIRAALEEHAAAASHRRPRTRRSPTHGSPQAAPDASPPVAKPSDLSPTELAMLDQIDDPEQRELQRLQMMMQKQALTATVLTNMASMRHDMLKAIAQNFRG